MNDIRLIKRQIEKLKSLHLIESVEVIVSKRRVFKSRLIISENLFVQIYRNDKHSTTSFALILNRRRIYGRDELGGTWHKHPSGNPDIHDSSAEGTEEVDLLQFWQEAEHALRALDIP
jgi:hypothetical protein